METRSNKFLTFSLDKEFYGIPIKKVKEIIGMMEFTHIPKTKPYIKGVMNLRGKIIPVMDLRLKFGMPEISYHDRTCIIVIEVMLHETKRLIGMIVDTVSEVVNIQPGEVEAPPEYGNSVDGNFLTGIGKLKDRVVLILDIEKILSSEDIAIIKKEVATTLETDDK